MSNVDTHLVKHDEIIVTAAGGVRKEADVWNSREVGRGSGLLAAEAPELDTTIGIETDDVCETPAFGSGDYRSDR